MKNNHKLPITRLNKFWSDTDFDFNVSLGNEYMGDLNMKLILFRVDREKTDTDDVYGETGKDKIRFFPPVEFNAIVKIAPPENKDYQNGTMRYVEPGNMTFTVYERHLHDLGVEIRYGDYIGWQESEEKVRYYTVVDDGRVIADNKHTMHGYKPYYNTITCAPAQEAEFRGI